MIRKLCILILICLILQFGIAYAEFSDYADPYNFDSWIGTTKTQFDAGNPVAKNSDFGVEEYADGDVIGYYNNTIDFNYLGKVPSSNIIVRASCLVGKYNESVDSYYEVNDPVINHLAYVISHENMYSSVREKVLEQIYQQIIVLHKESPSFYCYYPSFEDRSEANSISKSYFFEDGIYAPDEDLAYGAIWELDNHFIWLETNRYWTILSFDLYN